MKYAIKYLRLKYDETTDILIPKKVIKGTFKTHDSFTTGKETFKYITSKDLDEKYIVGDACTLQEMKEQFWYQNEDIREKDLLDFFFTDKLDSVYLLRDGKILAIDLYELFSDNEEKILYDCLQGENCLYLNQQAFDVLEKINDLDTLKEILRTYSDKLISFDEKRIRDGVDAVLVKDGKIVEVAIDSIEDYKNDDLVNYNSKNTEQSKDINDSDYSVEGLYNYLKENIIGHDEELKKIATIIYMNYMSTPEYGTESILIPGPTGTGKTATFNCAAKYFDIPFRNINACNLVPGGIVGTTIEDEFDMIIDSCNGNVKKAEKSILVFDEFDKIGVDELDIKKTLVNIFLKIFEGTSFPIVRENRPNQIFNTLMSTKIGLGTFVEAYKKEKNSIGFGKLDSSEEHFDKELLVKKGYFSQELLTRFQHFIPYKDLSEEDKRRIILESKLSTYLNKKDRFKKQFGITIQGDEEFAKGVLESLKLEQKSVRDLSNIINAAFLDIEYEVLSNKGKYKKLILNRNTVSNKDYDLK